MDKIASELLVERLAEWGVDTVFGLPGDGINGIMEGLRRHQDKVRFVLVHHEEAAAAFMAAGYASLARGTVSHLSFPNDLQVAPADAEPWPTVGPARTPATAPTSTTRPRSPCWSGRALSAPARRSWRPPRRWPARSSRPCRARRPYPTTTPSPPAGWGCSGPSRARRPSTSATPC